jgi:hypothetical protein
MRTRIKKLLVCVAAIGASAAALYSSGAPERVLAGSTRKIDAHGYVVDLTLEQQFRFPGTELAFQAVVTDVLQPRYVNIEGLEYVYTPVVVTVSKMYKGPRPESNKMTLRVLGGIANGLEYEADFAPSDEIMNRGVKLLVVGPNPVEVADDGVLAMTPSGLHVMHGRDVIDATFNSKHREHVPAKLDIADAESILSKK